MVVFDKVLEEMGEMSRSQWIQLILMFVPSIFVASQMGSMVFLGHSVDYRCEYFDEKQLQKKCNKTWTINQTCEFVPTVKEELSKCKSYNLTEEKGITNCSYWWNEENYCRNKSLESIPVVSCSSWVYNQSGIFTSTIMNEFNLVCSDDYKRKLAQSIFMVGVTFGCIFWGQISDRYGRKRTFVVSSLVGMIFAVCVAFTHSYAAFVTLRGLSGFCLFAVYTTGFVMATEIVPPKYRVRIAQTTQAFFASGFCVLALYGYFVRDWRNLQLLLSVPFVAFGAYMWITFESPRWLLSNNRDEEAKVIIEEFLKNIKNKENIEGLLELEDNDLNRCKETANDTDIRKEHGITDLLRTPNMRSKSFKLFYCWLVCSCVYYGLTLNSADIGGDPFINLFISGFVEIPAVYICIPLLENWGRRPCLSLSLILSGVACVAMLFVPKQMFVLNIFLSMIGKFAIAIGFATVYIFAAELYPTPIRNVGIGVCSSFARVGAILSPIIAMLTDVAKPLPYVVFGTMSIIGGILALFLPEVLGIRLPETIEEGEEFGKNQQGLLSFLCTEQKHNATDESGCSENIDYMAVPAKKTLVENKI